MNKIINILQKACEAYTNTSDYYEMTDEEMDIVRETLNMPVQSLITDPFYDEMYKRAKDLYSTDPFFNSVGYESSSRKVKLPFVMGSMKEMHLGEIEPWLRKDKEYTVSAKLDGCSAGIVYENGVMKEAYTRGNGFEGQIITDIVKNFSIKVPETVFGDLMVRGEIIVAKSEIPLLLEELRKETGKTYKNGRNTVAGMLNSKTISKAFSKYARFLAYHIENSDKTEYEMFKTLKEYGFETPMFYKGLGEELTEDFLVDLNKKLKETYAYEVDGVIITKNIKVGDDNEYWTGTINPKCSVKFKVGCADNYAESKIVGLKWQLSSYGYLKPVIEIEPVELDGSTITFATGNNYENVLKMHLCVGATVRLHKAGLVIPFIDDVISYPTIENYCLPENCETYQDGVDLVYEIGSNDDMDKEVSLQQLVYFCNKLDVEYAGEGNLKRLMEYTENIHMSPRNLMLLPQSVFQSSIGINGLKLYASLHNRLKLATVSQLMDAVSAFGRGIGELKLNKIVDVYKELPFDYDKIVDVDGWSDKSAEQYMSTYGSFINWWKFFTNELKLEMKWTDVVQTSNDYQDIVVVFTGIRDKMMEKAIKDGGGTIVSSCTKKCNTIIAKDVNENSTKMKKAREQGCRILSYDDAMVEFMGGL